MDNKHQEPDYPERNEVCMHACICMHGCSCVWSVCAWVYKCVECVCVSGVCMCVGVSGEDEHSLVVR